MDKKPWYEKISIWITSIAGIFTILGISIFGNTPLIKYKENIEISSTNYDKNNDKIITEEDEISSDISTEKVDENNIYAQVIYNGLNIRSKPDFESDIIALADKGDIFLVNNILIYDEDIWYEIYIYDNKGYIISDNAKIIKQ